MIQNQKIKFAKEVIFQEINALKKLSKSYNTNFIKTIDLIQRCKGKIICVADGKQVNIPVPMCSAMWGHFIVTGKQIGRAHV